MAAIPSTAEEDARRPNREHQRLREESTALISRMKSTLVRFGIRNFNVKLVKACERLEALRGPEGVPLPPNTLAEMRRDMARLRLVREQMKIIEKSRVERLAKTPREGTNPMVLMLARVMGIGIETADMLVHEILMRNLRDRRAVARYAARREREQATGKRPGQGRQCPGPARPRPAGVALAYVPEGQRLGTMVPQTDRERQRRYPQDNDRRAGTQAADCAVALCNPRRGAAGHRPAPYAVTETNWGVTNSNRHTVRH